MRCLLSISWIVAISPGCPGVVWCPQFSACHSVPHLRPQVGPGQRVAQGVGTCVFHIYEKSPAKNQKEKFKHCRIKWTFLNLYLRVLSLKYNAGHVSNLPVPIHRRHSKNLKFQSFSGGFDQVSVLTVILTAVCLPSANLRFYVKTLNLGKILRLSMKNYDSFSPLELWTTILLPPPLPLSSAGLSVARRDARKLMYLPSDVM